MSEPVATIAAKNAAETEVGDTQAPRRRGQVVTFYSYKGGVGRSMALANVAALLARWGQRVLVIDWDLEAPGIEKYFARWLYGSRKETRGIVDLVESQAEGNPIDWRECLMSAKPPGLVPIAILTAGLDNDRYVGRVRKLDWQQLFGEARFGSFLEKMRSEWVAEYDFVLVDSRTGVTDIGGICTIHLPDILVPLFTANEQSVVGVRDIMQRARKAHAQLPLDRKRLLVVPVPARDESTSEYKLAQQWRDRFAIELKEFFDDWMPVGEKPTVVLDFLKIPYFAYWSFGERIPVLEQEDPENPKTLAFAYQPLARMLLSRLDWSEARAGQQATEASKEQEAAAAQKKLETAKALAAAQKQQVEREAVRLEIAQVEEGRQRQERLAQIDKYVKERCEQQIEFHLKKVSLLKQRQMLWIAGTVVAPIASYVFFSGMWGLPLSFVPRMVLGVASTLLSLIFIGAGLDIPDGIRSHQELAEMLKRELMLFQTGIPPYDTGDLIASFGQFSQRVEVILEEGTEVLRVKRRVLRSGNLALGEKKIDLTASSALESQQEAARSVMKKGVAPSGGGAPIASAPAPAPTPPATAYRYTAFISYRRSELVERWLRDDFVPLLTTWLAEFFPDDNGQVFVFFQDIAAGSDMKQQWQEGLRASRCLIPILTPSYFRSDNTALEQGVFRKRKGSVIAPVWFAGELEQMSDAMKSITLADFRRFAYAGEGFRKTELYIEFQDAVRRFAEQVAKMAREAPPFDSGGPDTHPSAG